MRIWFEAMRIPVWVDDWGASRRLRGCDVLTGGFAMARWIRKRGQGAEQHEMRRLPLPVVAVRRRKAGSSFVGSWVVYV
jgi:hypothetical protein